MVLCIEPAVLLEHVHPSAEVEILLLQNLWCIQPIQMQQSRLAWPAGVAMEGNEQLI